MLEQMVAPNTVLNIGAGFEKMAFPDYPNAKVLNMDLDPLTEPDILGDIRDIPLEDGAVDWAISKHTLEHLPWGQVIGTLQEWARVVKPGGLLIVIVPDMGWAASELLSGHYTAAIQGMIFGGQTDEFQEIVHADRGLAGIKTTVGGKHQSTEIVYQLEVVGRKPINEAREAQKEN
jgi:predicted SAM-dependent methyltransferase